MVCEVIAAGAFGGEYEDEDVDEEEAVDVPDAGEDELDGEDDEEGAVPALPEASALRLGLVTSAPAAGIRTVGPCASAAAT
jgi:hypothetical protein